ncbi:phosphoribosylaminoimidazolesuccinocarboxamide synthase [Thermoproteota archaeon]
MNKDILIRRPVVTDITIPGLKLFKKGKVRSLFDLGETLLIVASDRVSAFDYILPDGIPGKGAVLTTVSEFWFNYTKECVANHLISTNIGDFPTEVQAYADVLEGRSMLVKKTQLIEVECVVRGYLAGSGWKEYQRSGTVCGEALPKGLQLASKLPHNIFTPATKAAEGHDENISFQQMCDLIGTELSEKIKMISFKLYEKGREYAESKGIILADTKFEFGLLSGELILIDELMTPDSSRFWGGQDYMPGISPPSFDKQIIRDYLENSGWNKQPPVPHLPKDIIAKASAKYKEVQDLLVITN